MATDMNGHNPDVQLQGVQAELEISRMNLQQALQELDATKRTLLQERINDAICVIDGLVEIFNQAMNPPLPGQEESQKTSMMLADKLTTALDRWRTRRTLLIQRGPLPGGKPPARP